MLVRKWKVKYNKVLLLKIYVYWFKFPMFPVLLHIMVIKRIIRSDYRERSKEPWILFLRAVYFLSYWTVDFQVQRPNPVITRGSCTCTCNELVSGNSRIYYSSVLEALVLQPRTFLLSYFSAHYAPSLYIGSAHDWMGSESPIHLAIVISLDVTHDPRLADESLCLGLAYRKINRGNYFCFCVPGTERLADNG